MRKGTKTTQGGTVKTYKAPMSKGEKNTPGPASKAQSGKSPAGRSGNSKSKY